ncbi:XdhC family protein [Jatrophihabitans lederbergiae]|uniref:XdhC family protein n=1 Tax=Jatrophihabitans lederbergiae TaxID=3075547 RepID=A0ABU2J6P5_9ACTN|nr:XdhC family protein [Jatrophihabitans sp. DSM 44399]MDT0260657.1 XdhC family protein [Jatrophihabitans sp. DSM 44399]
MRDVLADLLRWWESGAEVGIGTVVSTWSSAPRQPGASMLVGPDGTAAGSVSGGCVEGAVYELATEVRAGGVPVLQRYGVSDDDAFAVGLTCGGIIDIFVERIGPQSYPELGDIATDIQAGRPVAVATVVDAPEGQRGRRLVVRPAGASGTLGSERLDDAVRDDALGLLAQGRTGVIRYGPHGERRLDDIGVFVAAYAPRPRLIVFGAIDFASAVARIGSFLGYRVTVCDARPIFATRKRFPDADEVVVEWPHRYLAGTEVDERTVICLLTHDPKFDVPLLELALRMPLAYVGAMGSRRTNDDRLSRLRELGFSEDELARLHAPIGVDIGARTPEETAVSIAAEIIAARWGGTGEPLRVTAGPIHVDHPGPLSVG